MGKEMTLADKKYEKLLRQSIQTQAKLMSTLDSHNELTRNLSKNLEGLNTTIVVNNQALHENVNSVKNDIKELSTKHLEIIKWLVGLVIVVTFAAAGLKIAGII
jgi:gas vesicle protein